MDSFACHSERGMIAGETVAAGTLTGTLVGWLQTRCARTLVTAPVDRASIRSDGPTHHGLPSRHPRRRCSGDATSGASSASGAA